ncbi:MAG: hypothetical protein HUU18_03805 [Phycisphaerales bacterium]|nr:hypothetical protein [Phycisphaerales bacterium]
MALEREKEERRIELPSERMQRELDRFKTLLAQERPRSSDGAKSLEERLHNDAKVLGGFPEFRQDNWSLLSPKDRRWALQEAEYRLAQVQGRDAARVYCVDLSKVKIDGEPIIARGGIITERGSFQHGYAPGALIQLDLGLLRNDIATRTPSQAEHVLDAFTEESRHVYQASAILHPKRHPEVDDSTRQAWYAARLAYADIKTRKEYDANLLEVDAQQYSVQMKVHRRVEAHSA